MLNVSHDQYDDLVVVALGSNLPGVHASSRALLEAALGAFPSFGLNVALASRWWRSSAWPDKAHPDYLNGVVVVETSLDPLETLDAARSLEAAFGRHRTSANAPRTLDIDLIAHGRRILATPDLVLPHPRAHERRFVMGPLAEIAPLWAHPTLDVTAAELALTAEIGRDATPIAVDAP